MTRMPFKWISARKFCRRVFTLQLFPEFFERSLDHEKLFFLRTSPHFRWIVRDLPCDVVIFRFLDPRLTRLGRESGCLASFASRGRTAHDSSCLLCKGTGKRLVAAERTRL